MAKIPEYYNVGNRDNITNEELLRIMEDMYKKIAIALNKKPDIFERETNGLSTDTQLSIGSININTNTNKIEMLVAHPTAASVTWKEI